MKRLSYILTAAAVTLAAVLGVIVVQLSRQKSKHFIMNGYYSQLI